MAVDDTKINYYSGWEIDQIIDQGTVSVGSGTSIVASLSNAENPNVYEVQFQPSGLQEWYMIGQNSTNATIANGFSFSTYVDGADIYITTSSAGTARYFIWSDTVVH